MRVLKTIVRRIQAKEPKHSTTIGPSLQRRLPVLLACLFAYVLYLMAAGYGLGLPGADTICGFADESVFGGVIIIGGPSLVLFSYAFLMYLHRGRD